ncbi:unnamed protein product [Echinostoma caproni]|uniref:Protein KTI12 homolog n=1 Tax=Echinostoma caproni TaxID=27848 RepID=A0A183ANP8_9TREM|nr:unnamed protein product [Echinostoma caproni]
MPLITVCGYPCSGKSSVVAALVHALQLAKISEEIVALPEPLPASTDDDPRVRIYADSVKERELRGQHKSEVERFLSGGSDAVGGDVRNPIVIMDACNYIKGYRYELYCLAKSLKHQQAVLFCDTPPETVAEWNEKAHRYPPELLSDMISRFEAPQASQRWDSPLLVIKPHLWQSADQIDVTSVVMDLKSVFSPSNPTVQPNRSTLRSAPVPTDFLQTLESVTQSVVDHILQSQAMKSPVIGLPPSIARGTTNSGPQINLAHRPVGYSLPELARFKRRYIGMQKNKISDPTTAQDFPNATVIAAEFMNFIACSSGCP